MFWQSLKIITVIYEYLRGAENFNLTCELCYLPGSRIRILLVGLSSLRITCASMVLMWSLSDRILSTWIRKGSHPHECTTACLEIMTMIVSITLPFDIMNPC